MFQVTKMSKCWMKLLYMHTGFVKVQLYSAKMTLRVPNVSIHKYFHMKLYSKNMDFFLVSSCKFNLGSERQVGFFPSCASSAIIKGLQTKSDSQLHLFNPINFKSMLSVTSVQPHYFQWGCTDITYWNLGNYFIDDARRVGFNSFPLRCVVSAVIISEKQYKIYFYH